ncbi:MAG TPA: GNAT family N-acetyltransferase [Saprospiraceae bacterium]|nr:GNAT family N-acetyltransferase [Saprospiraceae bacterium]
MTAKELYITRTGENLKAPLFHQPWWLDIVTAGSWDVVLSFDKNDEIIGVLPMAVERKWGMNISRMPPLTPYLGPWISASHKTLNFAVYSRENRILKDLIGQLPAFNYLGCKCLPTFTNWYPFYLANYSQTTAYTYILYDIANKENLWAGMKNTVRTDITRASKQGNIVSLWDANKLYELQKRTFDRQNLNIPYSQELLNALVDAIKTRNCGQMIFALNAENKMCAGILVVWDQDCAYNLIMGMDDRMEMHGAIQWLIWHSINITSAFVSTYNFEGSMLPNIEPVFRHFGGFRTPYYKIWKDKNRLITLARTALGR